MTPDDTATLQLVEEVTAGLPRETLAGLLDNVERFMRRFVTFSSDAQSAAVALWVAHVYAIGAAPSAAYLRITSAVEESGKTTLLEVLELLLADRCLNLVSATPSFVFRHRDKVGPVALLLDEIDNTLKDRKDDGARDLLALVNAGYRRSAKVGRTVGREHEGRFFKAFGPAAIAGLGSLAPRPRVGASPSLLSARSAARVSGGCPSWWRPRLRRSPGDSPRGRPMKRSGRCARLARTSPLSFGTVMPKAGGRYSRSPTLPTLSGRRPRGRPRCRYTQTGTPRTR